jgi:cytochrome c peroxidase
MRKDHGAVKTPTLRAVRATAPYFSRGQLDSLDTVVRFYERGGVETDTRDAEMFRFTLTPGERADLVYYLGTL